MLTKGIPNNGYLNLCKMKIDVGKKGTKKKLSQRKFEIGYSDIVGQKFYPSMFFAH